MSLYKRRFGHRGRHTGRSHVNVKWAVHKPRRDAWNRPCPHSPGINLAFTFIPDFWPLQLRGITYLLLSHLVCGTLLGWEQINTVRDLGLNVVTYKWHVSTSKCVNDFSRIPLAKRKLKKDYFFMLPSPTYTFF